MLRFTVDRRQEGQSRTLGQRPEGVRGGADRHRKWLSREGPRATPLEEEQALGPGPGRMEGWEQGGSEGDVAWGGEMQGPLGHFQRGTVFFMSQEPCGSSTGRAPP